ncbi:radical SAM protein [Desulfobotulus sp. H1]|uniref:Radical SAM protein n=1 Tax=Desulfobotulus pelophilus TaxID=2823377 RepID=A0ABT3N7X3_9BACT|nr:radical SAM protein [Desulfobotulus pelophilus]MCW7753137.1 radical SAM protein [Desulfobotulus pelophilus]
MALVQEYPCFEEENFKEYGEGVQRLCYAEGEKARKGMDERRRILTSLAGKVVDGCKGTKPDMSRLSPGCALCAAGEWSCLFINGKCNGSCFYCPAPQNEESVPASQGLNFLLPDAYADYVAGLGFRGVGFSGGEPLLTLGRTLDYIRAVRDRMGLGIHLWMYTNGILVSRENLKALARAGLDEIRFDIGAMDYRLDRAAMAADFLPVVTVEIPAVPEEEARLMVKIPEMAAVGIRYLNLHQLRLTPHNFKRMASRRYTYIRDAHLTVMESEITALRLLAMARDMDLPLGVNYCSFAFKHRFQQAALRRKTSPMAAFSDEGLTENGYLRQLTLEGPVLYLEEEAARLGKIGADPGLYRLTARKDGLRISSELAGIVRPGPCTGRLLYSGVRLMNMEEAPLGAKEMQFGEHCRMGRVRLPAVDPIVLGKEDLKAFLTWLAVPSEGALPEKALPFEAVLPGLQAYA